jgi:hypothetical protein
LTSISQKTVPPSFQPAQVVVDYLTAPISEETTPPSFQPAQVVVDYLTAPISKETTPPSIQPAQVVVDYLTEPISKGTNPPSFLPAQVVVDYFEPVPQPSVVSPLPSVSPVVEQFLYPTTETREPSLLRLTPSSGIVKFDTSSPSLRPISTSRLVHGDSRFASRSGSVKLQANFVSMAMIAGLLVVAVVFY